MRLVIQGWDNEVYYKLCVTQIPQNLGTVRKARIYSFKNNSTSSDTIYEGTMCRGDTKEICYQIIQPGVF